MQIRPRMFTALSLFVFAAVSCKTTDETSPAQAVVAAAFPGAPEPPTAGQTVNGFTIANFEYWPFRWKEAVGTCPYPYPTGVRYGFAAGGNAARECMRQAYKALWAILHDPPPALTKLRDAGGPKSFYLWVNDYTEAKSDATGEPVAACQPDPTMRRVWHFNPPHGQIKWVNELMADGTCKLRTAADLEAFATATLGEVSAEL